MSIEDAAAHARAAFPEQFPNAISNVGAAPTPQIDNLHNLAMGAGVTVIVAVALLAWFKIKKTEKANGGDVAAQSSICEQAEDEQHDLQFGISKVNAMKLEKLQSAQKLFFILLSIDIAVTVIDIISGIWTIGALKDIESGFRTGDPSLASTIDFWASFSMIMILTSIGVGLALVNWLKSCYQFAKDSLHVTGFKQEGWTVAGWVVPIANLFKPYQVINEIYKAGSPTHIGFDEWKKESSSGLLLTWWIFWAVAHFLMFTIGKEMFRKGLHQGSDLTIPQLIGVYEVSAWSCVISIVIAGLWFVVANHLTLRLADRFRCYEPKTNLYDSTEAATVSSEHHYVKTKAYVGQDAPAVAKYADTVLTSPTNAKPAMNSQAQVNALPAIAIESSRQTMLEVGDQLYEQIAQEVETNAVDKGIWTRAFAQSDGDDKRTRVAYIKARFEKLMAAETASVEAMKQVRFKIQQESSEKARLELEQQKRENADRIAQLRERIKITGSAGLEVEIDELVNSVDGDDFLNWCCGRFKDKIRIAVENNPLLLLIANKSGNTALHLAVMRNQPESAKYLASKGASVSKRNNNGDSPIDIAKRHEELHDLVTLLQKFCVA